MDPSIEDDEDEQLRLAIAMSLQDQATTTTSDGEKTFFDLLDDDEPAAPANQEVATGDPVQAKEGESKPTQSGFLGLDRKAMEEERLARNNRKRKASGSISPPPLARTVKAIRGKGPSFSTPPAAKPASSKAASVPLTRHSSSALQYPNGAVKKTWSFGYARDNDIKIEEVLQRSTLQLAVLSSFQWDIDWIFAKLDMPRTKVVLAMQAKEESTKQQYRQETASTPNLRLCFPSMTGNVHCMHSKLMLLSHPTHLRIVVPTANLVPYDWGELGVLENSVFLVDLPRLPNDAPAQEEESLTFFGQELLYFCRAMGLTPDITNSLFRFDFSATRDYAFVHTIGGEHAGPEEPWRRTGVPGLGRAVKQLGLESNTEVELDFIASSIGSLNMDFLSSLYLAAKGDDGTTEYSWRNNPKPRGKKAPSASTEEVSKTATHKAVEDHFRLFFPSHDTILNSKGGVNAAGPICFHKKWWENGKFPQKVMRDCKSTRPGLLMHNKIIYVRPIGPSKLSGEASVDSNTSTVDGDSQPKATTAKAPRLWAYIGSANCGESAWGRMVLDRTRKIPKLGCRNWECGVIIPIRDAENGSDPSDKAGYPAGLRLFERKVPVPIEWPGESMVGRTPWFFTTDEGA
ncbi:MAG: hypothetical protein MMC23_000299 [Stictis urceolatum]|nr:hypothetical protein [Stictis urceolata]